MLLPLGQRRRLSSFMSVLNDNNVAEFTVGGLRTTIKAIKTLFPFSDFLLHCCVLYYHLSRVGKFLLKMTQDGSRSLLLHLFPSHEF